MWINKKLETPWCNVIQYNTAFKHNLSYKRWAKLCWLIVINYLSAVSFRFPRTDFHKKWMEGSPGRHGGELKHEHEHEENVVDGREIKQETSLSLSDVDVSPLGLFLSSLALFKTKRWPLSITAVIAERGEAVRSLWLHEASAHELIGWISDRNR